MDRRRGFRGLAAALVAAAGLTACAAGRTGAQPDPAGSGAANGPGPVSARIPLIPSPQPPQIQAPVRLDLRYFFAKSAIHPDSFAFVCGF